MKKVMMFLGIVVFFVTGGVCVAAMDGSTAMASSGNSASVGNIPPNDLIVWYWEQLPSEEKQWYIQHPAPTWMFPFGIDTSVGAPKGYPACWPATYPATYPPPINKNYC